MRALLPASPRPPGQARSAARRGPPARVQRGASLVVIVVMLLGVALLSLTMFGVSRGQFSLAGNLQHQEQAFQQAEATAAVAEQWLAVAANAQSAAFDPAATAQPGLFAPGRMAALGLDPRTMTWDDTNSVATAGGRYVIEQIARAARLPGGSLQTGQRNTGACRSVDLFRVVARSEGARGASRMVETLIATDGCYGTEIAP